MYALVTGGTRGIGRAIVEAFLNEGYKVATLYHGSEDKANELRKKGVLAIKCDVGDRKQVREAKEIIEKEFPELDVLVNNAGT